MLAGTTFSDLLRLEPMTLRLGCQKSGVRQSVRGEKVTTLRCTNSSGTRNNTILKTSLESKDGCLNLLRIIFALCKFANSPMQSNQVLTLFLALRSVNHLVS